MKNSAIESTTVAWGSAAVVWFLASWFAWLTAVWSTSQHHGSWLLITGGIVACASIALRWPFLNSTQHVAWGNRAIRVGNIVLVLCYGALVCWVGAIVLRSTVSIDAIPAIVILGLVELAMLRALPREWWVNSKRFRASLNERLRLTGRSGQLGKRLQHLHANCTKILSHWVETVSRSLRLDSDQSVAPERAIAEEADQCVAPEVLDGSIDLELESKLAALAGFANTDAHDEPHDAANELEQSLEDLQVDGGSQDTVLSRCTEGLNELGQRYFSGETHLKFSARQTNSSVVVPFCPAFSHPPQIDVECDDEQVVCRILHCTPTGARIALRRPDASQENSCVVQWFASLSENCSGADENEPSCVYDTTLVSEQKMLLP